MKEIWCDLFLNLLRHRENVTSTIGLSYRKLSTILKNLQLSGKIHKSLAVLSYFKIFSIPKKPTFTVSRSSFWMSCQLIWMFIGLPTIWVVMLHDASCRLSPYKRLFILSTNSFTHATSFSSVHSYLMSLQYLSTGSRCDPRSGIDYSTCCSLAHTANENIFHS